jgi:uncharacterized protein
MSAGKGRPQGGQDMARAAKADWSQAEWADLKGVGEGPPPADVVKWLGKAKSGDPQAYYELGLTYSLGRGVEADMVQAHKWFNLAAMSGLKQAQADRAEMAEMMSQQDIAEALRLARQWLHETH